MRVRDESRERMAASGRSSGEGAVGKTRKMRDLTLKSKAGSKCWLTPPAPPDTHKHTDSLSLSQKRSP